MAQPLYSLHGWTSFELVTRNMPDISEYISFQWFQPIWYYDSTAYPEPAKHCMMDWHTTQHWSGNVFLGFATIRDHYRPLCSQQRFFSVLAYSLITNFLILSK
jgi:hypothetical protein